MISIYIHKYIDLWKKYDILILTPSAHNFLPWPFCTYFSCIFPGFVSFTSISRQIVVSRHKLLTKKPDKYRGTWASVHARNHSTWLAKKKKIICLKENEGSSLIIQNGVETGETGYFHGQNWIRIFDGYLKLVWPINVRHLGISPKD